MTLNLLDKPALWDRESEMALVYLVLTDDVSLIEAPRLIQPAAFFDADYRLFYETALAVSPSKADATAVRQTLTDRGQFTDEVAESYRQIGEYYCSPALLRFHAARVWDRYQLRQFVNFGVEIVRDAYKPEAKPEELLTRCAALMHQTERPGQDDGTFLPATKAILLPADPDASGIETGLCDIDKPLQGMRKGESMVLAARPSCGKTALALQIAAHVALDLKIRTAYFTLESDKMTLVERIASQRTGVGFGLVRHRKMIEDETAKVSDLMKVLAAGWPLKIFKCRRFSLGDYEAAARRLVALENCGFIVVDYVQRMAWPTGCREKRLAVEENCRGIVDLAGLLNVPTLIISQLNRQAEGVEPGLEHLAESGTIEADIDIALLLHRPDGRAEPKAVAILAKQRNGRVGKFDLVWDGAHVKFLNATKQYAGSQAPAQHEIEQGDLIQVDEGPNPY